MTPLFISLQNKFMTHFMLMEKNASTFNHHIHMIWHCKYWKFNVSACRNANTDGSHHVRASA